MESVSLPLIYIPGICLIRRVGGREGVRSERAVVRGLKIVSCILFVSKGGGREGGRGGGREGGVRR